MLGVTGVNFCSKQSVLFAAKQDSERLYNKTRREIASGVLSALGACKPYLESARNMDSLTTALQMLTGEKSGSIIGALKLACHNNGVDPRTFSLLDGYLSDELRNLGFPLSTAKDMKAIGKRPNPKTEERLFTFAGL